MKYHFEKSVAMAVGVEEAIMLSNIEFWVETNARNERHFYDGCYWMFNSKKAFAELFPFWSEKQIRRILDNLLKYELIKAGNFNQQGYDKTLWYTSVRDDFLVALNNIGPNGPIETPKPSDGGAGETLGPNGPMDQPERANGSAQMGQPIPDNKPDNKSNDNVRKNNGQEKKGRASVLKSMPDLDISDDRKTELVELLIQATGDEQGRNYYRLAVAKVPEARLRVIIDRAKNKIGARNLGALVTKAIESYAAEERAEALAELPLDMEELRRSIGKW